jgi:hypothetical protein
LMRRRTSHRGTSLPVAARSRPAWDGEVPFIRYTTAENRSVHLATSCSSRGTMPFSQAFAPRQSECRAQVEVRPMLKAAAKAAGWRQSHALLEFFGRRVKGRCQLAQQRVGAAASFERTAVGFGAADSAQSPVLRGAEGRRVAGRPPAQSAHAAPQVSPAGGAHNRSVETDAQVLPCAARKRLLCAAHLQRYASKESAHGRR